MSRTTIPTWRIGPNKRLILSSFDQSRRELPRRKLRYNHAAGGSIAALTTVARFG
jgi:hypothetical protein